MGLFDKKGKKAKEDQAPENGVAVQQNVAQGVVEQPVQAVVETPPEVASSELSPVNIDNNPFVETPMPVAETPVQEVTPQVNLEDIFNATSDDLIMSEPQPVENVQTEVVIPVMEQTAATVDTPQPLAEQQVELSVNPTELVSESTIEDEITQLVSAAVDGTTVEAETPTETIPGPSLEQSVSAPTEPEYITEEVSVSNTPQEVSEPQAETTESVPLITDSVPQQEVIPTEEIPVTQEIQSEVIPNVPQTDATPEPIVQFEQPITETIQVEEIPTLDETTVAAVAENVVETNNGVDQLQEETFSDITPTETILPNEVIESQLETEQLLEAEQSGEAIVELSSEPLVEPAFVTPQESIMATTEPQEETIISVPPVKAAEPEIIVEQVENLPEAAHVAEEVLPNESVELPVEEIPTVEVEVPVENMEQPVETIVEEQLPVEMPAITEEQLTTESEITPNVESEITYQEEVQVEPVQEIVEQSELPSEPVIDEQPNIEQPTIEPVSEEQIPIIENTEAEVSEEQVLPPIEEVTDGTEIPVEEPTPVVEEPTLPEEVNEEKPTPIIVEDETVILPIIDVDTELPIGLSPEISEGNGESEQSEISEEPNEEGPLLSPIATPDINITVEEQPEVVEETSERTDEYESQEEQTYTDEPEYQEGPIHINEPIEPSINIDVAEHKHEVDPSDYIFPGEEKAQELEDKKMERPHLTERDGIVTYISDPTPTRFCNNCGIMLTDDSSICPSCGEPID